MNSVPKEKLNSEIAIRVYFLYIIEYTLVSGVSGSKGATSECLTLKLVSPTIIHPKEPVTTTKEGATILTYENLKRNQPPIILSEMENLLTKAIPGGPHRELEKKKKETRSQERSRFYRQEIKEAVMSFK